MYLQILSICPLKRIPKNSRCNNLFPQYFVDSRHAEIIRIRSDDKLWIIMPERDDLFQGNSRWNAEWTEETLSRELWAALIYFVKQQQSLLLLRKVLTDYIALLFQL